jgi:hypothetical protein
MSSRLSVSPPARALGRARSSAVTSFALALCLTWLVVQNAALLLLTRWPEAPIAWTMVRAVARAIWVLFERLWPIAAVAMVAVALMAWLVAGFTRSLGREVADGVDDAR